MNCRKLWIPLLTILAAVWMVFHSPSALAEPALEKGLCTEDREQWGLLCYQKCKPGFHGFMASCHQTCPPGFVDYGAGCSDLNIFAKQSYGRGAGEAMSCKPGSWQDGALCYEGCRAGYDGVGPVCWQQCPAGTDTDFGLACTRWPKVTGWSCWWIFCVPNMDWGWTHVKHSYGRGWGTPLDHCRPGTFQSGALCYPGCKDGYTGAGPVCWQTCPTTHRDDGAFCRRDNGFVKEMYFRDAGVPINYCPDYPRNTHYPIILVHGFSGFDTFRWFGQGQVMSYWHDVVPHMSRGRYGATVFVAQMPGFNTNESRGEYLMNYVDKVLKDTGKTRVHLIGHSQGAPTARFVASMMPDKVASVTSVGGLNYSTALVKLVEELAAWDAQGDPPERSWLRDVVNFFSPIFNWAAYHDAVKYPIDSGLTYVSVSDGGMRIFNWMHPWGLPSYTKGQGQDWDSPLGFVSKMKDEERQAILELNKTPSGRIRLRERADRLEKISREADQFPMLFYSWGGMQPFSNIVGFFTATAMLDQFVRDRFGAEPGDGIIEKSATRLGKMLGYYEQDHAGLSHTYWGVINLAVLWGKAHPLSLYCEHANRLLKAEKNLLGLSETGQAPKFLPVSTDPHGRPLAITRFVSSGPLAGAVEPADRWQCVGNSGFPTRLGPMGNVIAPSLNSRTILRPAAGQSCVAFAKTLPYGTMRPVVCRGTHPRDHWCSESARLLGTVPQVESQIALSREPRKSWQWQCLPGVFHPTRVNDRGNVEGLSFNGRDLAVQKSADECAAIADAPPVGQKIQPLVCGPNEHSREGHWCNAARHQLNDWQCRLGHADHYAPMRKNSQGDVQVLSANGVNVPWVKTPELCLQSIHERSANLQALTCGDAHKSLYGSTGYDNPSHWCAKNLDLK